MAALSLLACVSIVTAAPHDEITVFPVGRARVERGSHAETYRLPMGPQGVLSQPLVFLAAQPRSKTAPPPLLPDEAIEGSGVQVPATLKFTIAGRSLPSWELQAHGTAYVINIDTIKANPGFGTDSLALEIDLETTADAIQLQLLGMPDPLLLDRSTDGPLNDLARVATDPEVKAYLLALAGEIAGDKEEARGEYMKLSAAKNARVARFARRGLRMLSYELRKDKLSGNFMGHYRWGLYLQQCGLFAAAFQEFEECRIIFPWHGESQFRAGETLECLGGSLTGVIPYMNRTWEAARVANPADWFVLVVIFKSRGGATVTGDEVRRIKDRWMLVERMIQSASGGTVRIITSFYEIDKPTGETPVPQEKRQNGNKTIQSSALSTRQAAGESPAPQSAGRGASPAGQRDLGGGGGPCAATDDLVEARGWFDSVISVVPRLADESDAPPRIVGGDLGPNGAALACLFSDARWYDYLAAWYRHSAWAAEVGEIGHRYPLAGPTSNRPGRPLPRYGDDLRTILHDYFTPAMFRRLKICDTPVPGSHIHLWKVEGPYAISDKPPATGGPGRRVLDPIPSGPAPRTVRLVSKEDFIDLAKLFPDAGWARAQATSWVYSPEDREVRMWLGQNDGMAVWINGRCVHKGKYYSAGNYQDRDMVDTIAGCAGLRKGWNELRVVVESWPAPLDKGWGFSVRFCTWDNKPVPGIAYVHDRPVEDLAPRYTPPEPGSHYDWAGVEHDFHELLPVLDAAALEKITGVKGLHIIGAAHGNGGHVTIAAPGQAPSPTYRPLGRPWRVGEDRDVVLNNVLDWAREACAAYRYTKGGRDRDLLLVKPEALEAYLTLLQEPASAAKLFGGRPAEGRVLGYVLGPGGGQVGREAVRLLFVVDTLLGSENSTEKGVWPTDEEALLSPLGGHIPNAAFDQMGPSNP